MRPYSLDLRERIVEAVDQGMSKAEAARRFKVNRSTVYEYLDLSKQGNLKAKSPPGRPRTLKKEQVEALEKQVQAHPDLSLQEHADLFEAEHKVKLGFSTVNLYFKRLGITRKKRASMPANEMNQPEQLGSGQSLS